MDAVQQKSLKAVFDKLFETYGRQYWWPAKSPFEVMLGAILTQSTSWGNVEKAVANLKKANILSPRAVRGISTEALAQLIRPCGYYNQKAVKLKALAVWLKNTCGDDISHLMHEPDTNTLRESLLKVHGVGEETADSVLLYALGKPVFVVDAYTKRIIQRLGLIANSNSYQDFQKLFVDNLPADVKLYNEFHALIVKLAKDKCHKKPVCTGCSLKELCSYDGR